MMSHGNRTIQVEKKDLIAKIKENKENHIKEYAKAVKEGKEYTENISEDIFSEYMVTKGMPDPELLIRTSGELRISNFLLWQLAYTELYFTDVLWPDFRKNHLKEALESYQKRERRFGKISEQV